MIRLFVRYADQAASDAHVATPPVQDLIKLFTTGDVLAQPPEVHNASVAVKSVSGAPIPASSNPAIVILNVDYKSGTTTHAVQGWREAGESVKSIKGFNVWTVAEDKEASSVRAIYVGDSWESFDTFHKSGVAQRNQEHNGKDRTGVQGAVKIKVVDGFVGREDRSKL